MNIVNIVLWVIQGLLALPPDYSARTRLYSAPPKRHSERSEQSSPLSAFIPANRSVLSVMSHVYIQDQGSRIR